MNDLLSAASLFLAVLGLLYSAWYSEIRETLALQAPDYKDDRGPLIERVRAAYWTRAVPLAFGAVALALILTPDLVRTVWSFGAALWTVGLKTLATYDAVRTLFCAIAAMTIGFAIHACLLAVHLKRRLRELKA